MKEGRVFSIHAMLDPLDKDAGARGLLLLTEGDFGHRLKLMFRDHGNSQTVQRAPGETAASLG